MQDEKDPLADIADLVGAAGDGPIDLSTNAAHLDGFGEDRRVDDDVA
jgi:hypothetical protein